MKEGKSFQISQNEVLNAYKAVKANKGVGGVDGVDFEERMAEIHHELLSLQAESNELMDTISKNMEEMGL